LSHEIVDVGSDTLGCVSLEKRTSSRHIPWISLQYNLRRNQQHQPNLFIVFLAGHLLSIVIIIQKRETHKRNENEPYSLANRFITRTNPNGTFITLFQSWLGTYLAKERNARG